MENIADDPSGILLESVIEGMAEYYSAELAENVMRGMTENALEGKWPGGVVPLGYKLDEQHHLVIDGPKAEVVRLIYQMALEAQSEIHHRRAEPVPLHQFSRRPVLLQYAAYHSEKRKVYRSVHLGNCAQRECLPCYSG